MAAGHDRLTKEGKRFFAEIEELCKLETRVGFQHGEATDEESGADICDIAMWNELGTVGAPSRPFMRQSVDGNASQISAMCKAQLQLIAEGRATARKALMDIGNLQAGLIKHTIDSGDFVPNAPSTVKRKTTGKGGRLKGKGSKTAPLVDTGRMKQSVRFVIVPKGQD